MNLLKYNNKNIRVAINSGKVFEGPTSYCEADAFDEEFDALSIRQPIGGVLIFENEIKSIEVL